MDHIPVAETVLVAEDMLEAIDRYRELSSVSLGEVGECERYL